MKKRYIIYLCTALTLGIGYYIWYILDTTNATNFINYVIDILNKPLPIIGLTTGALLIFIWKLIATTNYGKKKLALYDLKLQDIEQAKQELEEEKEKAINELKEENKHLREQLANVCALSTNKKIKDYGKELTNYGEETIECETTTD